MRAKPDIHYDKEGDYLEVSFGSLKNTIFIDKGRGVFEIINKRTQQRVGFSIVGLQRWAKTFETVPRKTRLQPIHA